MAIVGLLILAYFGFLWLVAGRVQKMQDGVELPKKGILNRYAHRQRHRLIERGTWNGAIPDRTPVEVDARVREYRRARLQEEARRYGRSDDNRQSQHKNAEGNDWLPREQWIASIDNPDIPESGTWARFEYADADGVITKRSIRNWSKGGAYIEGFCMDRRAGRTFRQDRISDWICG